MLSKLRTFRLRRFPIKVAASLAFVGLIVLAISLIDLSPDHSHLKGGFYSGPEQGQYHAVVDTLTKRAKKRGGSLQNVATGGSVDNLRKLVASSKDCDAHFAIVQDGIAAPEGATLDLVGRLSKSESVFFLGKNAAALTRFEQLRDMTIGVGPKSSGSEYLARSIFESDDFATLATTLRPYPVLEQLSLLETGELKLGVFVMDEDAELVRNAIRHRGLQIAAFTHLDVVARKFAFVTVGRIGAGQFDAVAVRPATDRAVLRVNTLVLGNGCAGHAERVALLSLLSQEFPDFISHNRTSRGSDLFPVAASSQRYFDEGGASFFDLHVPWLVNIMPLGNWVYVAMFLSVFINLTTAWHRFRLWRIDANTDKADQIIRSIIGESVTPVEMLSLPPTSQHATPEALAGLDSALAAMDALRAKCRVQANSLLVPMGSESIYRYSEQQIEETLTAMRMFRDKARALASAAGSAAADEPASTKEADGIPAPETTA